MSGKRTDGRRSTGLLLLCWTLIGLCSAGPRPADRGQRPRYTRHHDRWVQGIQIPSHHGQGTQRIEFPSVNDEGAQRVRFPSANDRQAVRYPSVNDSGASSQIQKCAPGYYRDRSGPFLGRCVPCECNGLSDECEERTGRCLGCQYNTAGDRCEHCKEGYYGNAAQRTCRVCPCPLRSPSNSFAIGCKEVFGDFECVCRAGYTGDKCESCAPGYYGDPSTQGGSCRPCKCNGNGNYCDHKTGACKNPLEPEDTNTDQHCQECDNCAQTLLLALEKLDGELRRIKTQLNNASVSATSQERLKKLEQAVADTKILVNRFSSAINTQKSRVNQLEDDVSNLSDDISTLRDKADKSAAHADKAVADVANTHTRGKDLDSEIQKMLKKIQALLDQLKDAGTGGDVVPNENLAKILEEAQRLVKEMKERNFIPQKTAAEKERDEAEKLLDFIKANVSKQSDQNEAQAENLRGLLKNYEAKLKDLDKALKEAMDLLKKANTQNGLSAQALEDLKKRIKGLKMERDTVQDQITMAEKELQKTEDLANMLSESKAEYEQLAAQMDGAKTDLTEKVNEITEAASKKDLVEAAEEHANNLSKLAKDLEKAVANATGQTEVRNAKDAIDAYRNITDAINAAEAAANEAKVEADSTLNDLKKKKLTVRAKDLKESSQDLLKTAQEAETNLQGTADDITDLKNRLKDAGKKKTALQKDLADAQNQLNGIEKDDISATIDEAKRKAASANNSATVTMDRLNAIRGELEKIKVTPVDSNLNIALNDVDETVKNLLKTIPSLDDKLSEMETLSSEFPPINNISENIQKIKDLIEQARDAANRIGIPMMFKGGSHVELRAPKNLEDLKAYTSLTLSLQRPQGRGDGRRRRRQAVDSGNMFVLYLGNRDSSKNYIGMVLRNEVLYGVYKLNGVEYQMETGVITKSVPVPAKFDTVDLRRIYQDAKMTLTKFTNSKIVFDPITAESKGEENKNLLDLSPSDIVFYVGGYPDDFTPPSSLNFPKYEGCIEFSSVNDKVVSLYNFRNAVNINPDLPCKRYVPPMDSDFYEGTGYGKVLLEPKKPVLLINMFVSSRSSNGLLSYIESEDKYFTVTIEKGVIFLRGNFPESPATLNVKSFPTSDYEQFSIVILPSGSMSVRIGTTVVADAKATYNFDGFKECYIGGAPKDVRERYNITMQPFKGCVKNLKQNSAVKSVSEAVGISKGCPKDSLVVRKADFSMGSTLSADLTGFSLANDVTVSLGFKSTQNEGIILQDKQLANGMQLTLESGFVILTFNDKIWKSSKQYQDGKWHYLTATRRNGRVNLLIDDEDAGQAQSGSTSVPETRGSLILGKNNFKGCVSNLYTRRPAKLFEAEDLNDFVPSGDVLLDVCSADTLAQLMLDRSMKR